MRGFALDEYIGLEPGHPESYRAVITREVVDPLGLTPSLVRVPGDDGGPIEHAGESYERAIVEAGGVDLQVLGIGRTGHIGFNEPGSSLSSLTRVKTLTESTRADNARFFESIDDVPRHCLTQGLGTILRARKLVLLAFGESKAEAIAGAVEGAVSASRARIGDPVARGRHGDRRRGRAPAGSPMPTTTASPGTTGSTSSAEGSLRPAVRPRPRRP